MESINLDMDDLFENEAMDDDVGAVSALPDLPEYREDDGQGGEQDNEDAENTEVLAKLKDLSKGAAKKVVRKPIPKLDATRLTGERGIPILPKVFEKVRFKGKGHEAQDLALLMRNLEHWAHRLFPKMPFDEVIERAERLGAKREVQTCVKKMRLDIPILNEDFIGSDKEDDKEDDVIRQGDDLLPQGRTVQDMEDTWEDMIREAEESQAAQTPLRPSHNAPGPSHDTPGPSQNTPGLSYDTPGSADSQLSTPALQRTKTDSPFTPEQLERMERNQRIAREKRLAKMGIKSPATALTRPSPSSTQPSQSSSQETQNERVTSPEKQAGSQTNENSKSQKPKPQTIESDEDIEISSSVNKQLGSEDEQMSEVIRTQNDRVVVTKHQDAQNWCTEPSVGGQSETITEHMESTESASLTTATDEMTELENKTSENLKTRRNSEVAENVLRTNESNKMEEVENQITVNDKPIRDDSTANEVLDSEEMSEVVPNQNEGKVVLDKHVSKTQADSTESVEEMSEIIEQQDYKIPSVESDKENMSVLVNGIDKGDKNDAEDLKSKDRYVGDRRKGFVNGDIDMTGDKKAAVNGTDELNEDELMETLDC